MAPIGFVSFLHSLLQQLLLLLLRYTGIHQRNWVFFSSPVDLAVLKETELLKS